MNEVDFLAEEVKVRYGFIKRARGNFLYTAKGVRLTDMYRENGRAVLGWGGNSAFTMLKNVLSRGVTGSFDTEHLYRLERAVSEVLGSRRKIYIFMQKTQALEAALSIAPEKTVFFKPWDTACSLDDADAVIVEPPLAWTSGIYILALRDSKEMEARLSGKADSFQSCRIAPPMLAAATRALYDLEKAMQVLSEKDFFTYDYVLTKYWERRGPYLFPRQDVLTEDSYSDFVRHCLDCGVVVSPFYDVPSIVPFGVDRGVFCKLVKNPFVPADK